MRRARPGLRFRRARSLAACRRLAPLLMLMTLGAATPQAHAHSPEAAEPGSPAVAPSCPARGQSPAPDRDPIVPARHAALGLAALGVAALATGLARRRAADASPASAFALAGAFALFVIAGSPHLVHHTFDPDRGAACAVFQAASHGDGLAVAPATCPSLPVSGRLEHPRPRLRVMVQIRPASGRGPPDLPMRPTDTSIAPGP
jgi:hypothetical protein